MEIKIENVAKYFYDQNNRLTDKQIQKLTYYAYAWYFTMYKKKLFNENPEAWIHGPVFMQLYKILQNNDLVYADGECIKQDREVLNVVETVYSIYGKFSGTQLENLTHSEDPWRKARIGLRPDEKSRRIIKDEDIIAYYGA